MSLYCTTGPTKVTNEYNYSHPPNPLFGTAAEGVPMMGLVDLSGPVAVPT